MDSWYLKDLQLDCDLVAVMVCKIILACYQGMGESSAVSFTVEHDGL